MSGKGKGNPINDKIIKYLQSIAPFTAEAKVVSVSIKEPAATVRTYLSRLYHAGRIQKDSLGQYRAVLTLEDMLKSEDPEIAIHGLKLEGYCTRIQAPLPLLLEYFKDKAIQGSGKRSIQKFNFEGRVVTMELSEDGKLEIFLQTNKTPINAAAFERFAGWLDAKFDGQLPALSLQVTQVGIGRDFRVIRMEGLKAMPFFAFRNAVIQLYQKTPDVLRAECHWTGVIDFRDAISIVRGMAAIAGKESVYEPPTPDTRQDVS